MHTINIDKLDEKHDKQDIIKSLIKDDSLEVKFLYKSDYRNTKYLRDFVELICIEFNFCPKFQARMVIISDELNNNAIEYGSSAEAINIMRVKVKKDSSGMDFNLEVEDDGKGREHKTSLEMETMRAHQLKLGYFNHDSIRGRGLFLITTKIVNRLYFKNSINGGLIVGVKVKV